MKSSRPVRHALSSHLLAVAAIFSSWSATALAKDFTFDWNPRSGDVWLDTQLDDVNRYAGRYREPFVDELVRYHGAPRTLVTGLLDRGWAPGDVYMACSLAAMIGRPCRYVADQWTRDHGQGWGEMAQRMGIKPGSAEFHRLKRGIVPTYDRWARPILLDSELGKDFPGRRVGPARASVEDRRSALSKAHASKSAKPDKIAKDKRSNDKSALHKRESSPHGKAEAKGNGKH